MQHINDKQIIKEIATMVTQRGQVTIPAEVRKLLGVRPREKVAFAIDRGQVRLIAPRYTLESVAGSLKPTKTEDIERLIHEAKEERVTGNFC